MENKEFIKRKLQLRYNYFSSFSYKANKLIKEIDKKSQKILKKKEFEK